jgi:hypothetical protein
LILIACSRPTAREPVAELPAPPEPELVAEESPQPPPRDPLPTAPVPDEISGDLRYHVESVLGVGSMIVRGGPLGVALESLSNDAAPRPIGQILLPGTVNGLAVVREGLLAAGCAAEGVILIDITTPSEPRRVGRLDLVGAVWRLETAGPYTLIAAGHEGVVVADLRRPDRPVVIGRWASEGHVRQVRLLDSGLALVAEGRRGLVLLDLVDPARPRLVSRLDTPGEVRAVDVRDGIAFVADFHAGLAAVDISQGLRPSVGRPDHYK